MGKKKDAAGTTRDPSVCGLLALPLPQETGGAVGNVMHSGPCSVDGSVFADDDKPRGVALGSAGAFDTDVYGGGDKFAGYGPPRTAIDRRLPSYFFGLHVRASCLVPSTGLCHRQNLRALSRPAVALNVAADTVSR